MNVRHTAQGFELSDSAKAFLHTRLTTALRRFEEHVISVDVFMKDVNGPKGGRARSPGNAAAAGAVPHTYLCLKRAFFGIRRAFCPPSA